MEFRDNQAIYLQIAEFVCEQILLGKWKIGDKILSVRELAISLEVNPNTVMRTYDFLQQQEIIVNKRGIGFFISENSEKNILKYRQKEFIENELPVLFRNMYLLKIDFDTLNENYQKFIQENFKSS